jgi:hypothetical protein
MFDDRPYVCETGTCILRYDLQMKITVFWNVAPVILVAELSLVYLENGGRMFL